MQLGRECLDLIEYLTPRGRPAPVDSRSNDRWFQHVAIVVSDMDRAYAALRSTRAALVSPGLISLSDARLGYSRALFARDPDGHVMQLASE